MTLTENRLNGLDRQALGIGDVCGALIANRAPLFPTKPAEPEWVTHLRRLDPDGNHNVVVLDPLGAKAAIGRTFKADEMIALSSFVHEWNGQRNVYYSLNEPMAGAPDSKLAEKHIGSIRAVCADVDPRASHDLDSERDRILKMASQLPGDPLIVDSGGGYQLIWVLREKLNAREHNQLARDVGRSIAKRIGGDAVFDLPRILRLPGTLNLPTATKKAAGRQPRRAQLVRLGAGDSTLAQLAAHFPPVTQADAAPDRDEEIAQVQRSLDMIAIRSTGGIADLDDPVRARLKAALASDESLRRLWDGDVSVLGDDKSHSAFRAALAMRLARVGGFDAQAFGEILFAWDHAVGASQDHAEVLNERTIARDWVRCGAPHAAERWFAEPPAAVRSIWDDVPAVDPLPIGMGSFPTVDTIGGRPEAALLPRREWLIPHWCPANTVNAIVGAPGVSKSAYALLIAVAVATGQRAVLSGGGSAHDQVLGCGPVLIYNREDSVAEMKRRVVGLCSRHGLDAFPHQLHLASGTDGQRLVIVEREKRGDRIRRAAGFEGLRAKIRELRPVLVILDPLVSLSAGLDENSNDDMEALLAELRVLASIERVTILVVHHAGKNADRMSGELGASRGASSIVGAIRGGLTLTALKLTETPIEGPHRGMAPGHYVVVETIKANYGPKSDPVIYRLRPVAVGNGSDSNDAGDTVAVHELVDRSGAEAAANKVADERTAATALAVARIVDKVLGDRTEAPLNGELEKITPLLRAQQIQRGTTPHLVVNRLTEFLAGAGVEFCDEAKCQNVRISMRKLSESRTAPWIIRREEGDLQGLFK